MNQEKKHVEWYYKIIPIIIVLIIFYLIYKPLVVLLLIVLSGYPSTYLRQNFIYSRPIKIIIVIIIWSLSFLCGVYFLNKWFDSPLLIMIASYIIGLMGVAYLGYKKAESEPILLGTKLEDYYNIATVLSALIYIIGLIILNIFKI